MNKQRKYVFMLIAALCILVCGSMQADAADVRKINPGHGSDCIVLFYKDFKTTYSYTKLGYMEDATGLSEILGKGNVMITLKLN